MSDPENNPEPLFELIARLDTLLGLGDNATVAQQARLALQQRGPHPWLYALLATADNDIAAAREAIALLASDPEIGLQAAQVLLANAAEREAIAHAERLLRVCPDHADLARFLVVAWLQVQDKDKALRALERYAVITPDDHTGISALRAKLGQGALQNEALSSSYIRALFDGYADKYDESLLTNLFYCAPALCAGMLETELHDKQKLMICDLGCGTGLFAPHLKPYAGYLVGVDLAPRMLAKARARGLYDELVADDMVGYLQKQPAARFDVISCLDVLVYMGDLGLLFTAVHHALKPNGLFIATVETATGSAPYVLQSTRRYAHQPAYVQKLAQPNGLKTLQMLDHQPRREGREFINGTAFLLQKAG